MANIGLWAQTNMLNWVLRGGTPTQPPAVYVGLSLGAPSSVSFSEVAAGSGYSRQSPGFGPAAAITTSPFVGSASNSAAATFGPFSSSAVISGLFICDNATSATPNNLWFGNLATVRTPLAGDSLVLAIGALAVTLS